MLSMTRLALTVAAAAIVAGIHVTTAEGALIMHFKPRSVMPGDSVQATLVAGNPFSKPVVLYLVPVPSPIPPVSARSEGVIHIGTLVGRSHWFLAPRGKAGRYTAAIARPCRVCSGSKLIIAGEEGGRNDPSILILGQRRSALGSTSPGRDPRAVSTSSEDGTSATTVFIVAFTIALAALGLGISVIRRRRSRSRSAAEIRRNY